MNIDFAKTYTIASRGSKLALWQSNFISEQLAQRGVKTKIIVVSTKGDRVQNRFLHEIGGKGLFVKELEIAMAEGRADLAVHSTKDLPARLSDEFALVFWPRHSPLDVMIFREDVYANLKSEWGGVPEVLTASDLRSQGPLTIGTASLRRQALLQGHNLKPLRGNVDSRIAKLNQGQFEAIVLAHAALERLQWQHLPTALLAADWFVPSPAQGALSVEVHRDHPLAPLLAEMEHQPTASACRLERQILADLGGDCTMPIGCYAWFADGGVNLHVKVLNHQGQATSVNTRVAASWQDLDPPAISESIRERLAADGLAKILADLAKGPPDLGSLN